MPVRQHAVAVRMLVRREQSEVLDGEEPLAVFGAEVGDPVVQYVDDRARREVPGEAATHSAIEGDVVLTDGELPGGPERGCENSDTGRQDVDIVAGAGEPREARAAQEVVRRSAGFQAGEEGCEFEAGRGDEENAQAGLAR
jgi:hypothetical protein